MASRAIHLALTVQNTPQKHLPFEDKEPLGSPSTPTQENLPASLLASLPALQKAHSKKRVFHLISNENSASCSSTPISSIAKAKIYNFETDGDKQERLLMNDLLPKNKVARTQLALGIYYYEYALGKKFPFTQIAAYWLARAAQNPDCKKEVDSYVKALQGSEFRIAGNARFTLQTISQFYYTKYCKAPRSSHYLKFALKCSLKELGREIDIPLDLSSLKQKDFAPLFSKSHGFCSLIQYYKEHPTEVAPILAEINPSITQEILDLALASDPKQLHAIEPPVKRSKN